MDIVSDLVNYKKLAPIPLIFHQLPSNHHRHTCQMIENDVKIKPNILVSDSLTTLVYHCVQAEAGYTGSP